MLSIEITFDDEAGKSFKRVEVLDISQFKDVLFESFRSPNQGVEEAIKSLDTSRSRPHWDLMMTKQCSMCAERIPLAAKKCSHCGEMIEAVG